MKKITFLLATALGLGSFAAQESASATVNVRLYPIQTIIVNSGTEVNLDYDSAEDYAQGVKTDKIDHLSVYSTGAFAVKVKADEATLKSTQAGDKDNISSNDIWVKASAGTTNPLGGVKYKAAVSLTETAQELFSSGKGGVDKTFNVNYAAKGDLNKYVNKYFNVDNENPTVYTTTVTYTIEAR